MCFIIYLFIYLFINFDYLGKGLCFRMLVGSDIHWYGPTLALYLGRECLPQISRQLNRLTITGIPTTIHVHFDRICTAFLTFNFGHQLRIILLVRLQPTSSFTLRDTCLAN